MRRSPIALGAGALALGALLSTYVGAIRPPAAYARGGKSAAPTLIGASAVPAGCAPNATIVDDTVSLSAALAVGDDTVLCIVDSFTLDDTIVLDDTSLTLMGPDDTAVTLTSRADARHIVAASSGASDDTIAVYNMTLAGQGSVGSGGIYFDGGFGATNFDRVILDDSAAIVGSETGGLGGGAIQAKAHVLIRDSYIAANKGDIGGAVRLYGPLVIDGARFVGNEGGFGGAILQGFGTMTITDSQFSSNLVTGAGGAIFHTDRLVISNTTFVGNSSQNNGGAIYSDVTNRQAIIDTTTFRGNTADDTGGAIYFHSSGYDLLSLDRAWFDDNYAAESGAVHVADGSLTIQLSVFTGNDAAVRAGAVGDDSGTLLMETATFMNNGDDTAPSVGGALVGPLTGSAYMVNVSAFGNTADDTGGFAYLRGGTVANPDEIRSSTITGNSVTNSAGGGVAASASAVTTIINSVVQDNLQGATPDDVDLPAAGSSLSHSFLTSSSSVSPTSLGGGAGNLFGADPGLGAAGNNGGYPAGAVSDDTYLPTREPLTGSPLFNAATPATSNGQDLFDALGARRSRTGPNTIGAVQGSPPSPTPTPAVPAGPPLDVVAEPSNASVLITWAAPASVGSFPVTQYQVSGVPAGACLVPVTETSCVIEGLSNGVAYSFRVRALTGAGWGAWSEPVTVTPEPPVVEPSIVITGVRDGGLARVSGVTTSLVGSQVTPWVRLPGQVSYSAGVGVRTVQADGTFTWQRKSRKKVYVFFRAEDGIRSNRVIIPAR